MTFDDFIELSRELAASNWPSRKLVGVRLDFDEGKPCYFAMPDEKKIEGSDEIHDVEQAIIDALSNGPVIHKNLKNQVMKKTGCKATTFGNYLRSLRVNGWIISTEDGYKLNRRNSNDD